MASAKVKPVKAKADVQKGNLSCGEENLPEAPSLGKVTFKRTGNTVEMKAPPETRGAFHAVLRVAVLHQPRMRIHRHADNHRNEYGRNSAKAAGTDEVPEAATEFFAYVSPVVESEDLGSETPVVSLP